MKNLTHLGTGLLFGLFLMGAAAAQTTSVGDVDKQTKKMDTLADSKGQMQVANKTAASFITLAGSKENAVALVNALRNGTVVTLSGGAGTATDPATSTTFTPPTGKMGWGNVFISLALAQNALTQAGITKPTAEQLQAALMGGDVVGADGKTVTLQGVLQLRADGMGWGKIAQVYGTKLGPVVSSIKSANQRIAALPASTEARLATASSTKSAVAPKLSKTDIASAKAGKGLTTASATPAGHASAKGLTTANGAPSAASAKGNAFGKGVVTAAGGSGSAIVSGDHGAKGNGNALGKGVVNAAGGTGVGTLTSNTRGAGVSSGAGVVSANGAAASAISTPHGAGNGNGNGQGNGQGNGKGKGG